METIEKIIDLLDEVDRARETQRLMITTSSVDRTDIGRQFFMQRSRDLREAISELNKYPREWVEGAKTILEARKKKNIK